MASIVRSLPVTHFLILISVMLAAGSFAGCNSNVTPKKPNQIAKEAFWVGGNDGGVWVVLRDVRSDRFLAEIYHESGEPWISGWFAASLPTNTKIVNAKWLQENMNAFDGTNISLIGSSSSFRLEQNK